MLGANNLTVGTTNSTTFDGIIEGSGGFTKQGTGTLTLGGTNTYTGETAINAGALALTNIDAIQDSAKVMVATGAFFDLAGVTGYAKVRTVDGGGTVQLGDSGLEITNGSTEFSGVIASTSGSGGLTIAGGVQTLSGVSTYSSLTTLLQGATLALKGAGSIANSSSIVFQPAAAGNATFDISQTTTGASVLALNETRSSIGVVALGSKELVLTGTATDFLGTITDGGIDSGVGGRLTLAVDAGAILGGVNTYTGATTISAGATLKLVGGGSIEQSSEVNLTGATAIFDISGISVGGASIRSLVGNGRVDLGGNTLSVSAASGEFAGVIADGGSGGNLLLTGGTLILSGQSSYTGGTLIGQGATLALKGGGSIEDSMEIVFDPAGPGVATFDISQTTSGARVQTLLDVAGTGVIELGEKTLTVTVGGDFFGVIKGGIGGGLTIGAGASLGLWGVNTYTGVTIVGDNAVLSLEGDGSIASSSSLNLSGDNSIFDISCACTSPASVQNLAGSSTSTVILGGNDLTVVSSVNTIFAGVIDNGGGDGGLIKQGAATLTLSGINTYAGGTTINEGAISISSDANLGDVAGILVFGGGTLKTTADIAMSRATTLNIGGGTFDVATGTKLEHNGTIDGDGGLTKTGDGTLTLRGINAYAGETVINAGTLALSNGDISASSKVTVGAGATFDVSDNIGTVITALVGEGWVKLGASAGLVIANASGEFSGTITSDFCGCSTLAIAGGTQTLSGINTYAGITVLAAGATLALKGSGSIAHSTGVEFLPFGPGVATFDISQTTTGATVLGLADLDGVGVVSLGSKTLTVGANGGPFAGVIQDGGIGGGTGGSLSVASPGFGLQLAGANTYTGATTILAGGMLAIVGPGSIAVSSGVVLAGSGATLDISGDDDDQSQTIKDLSGIADTTVALGGNSLTVGTANSTSFAGVIADGGYYGGTGGSLIKQGSGTLTLGGANTYTGTTTINAGTLALSGNGDIAASSGVNLAATGATFDISGANGNRTIQDLNGVAGTSIVLGSNSLTVGTANNTSFAGNISGAGGLNKMGSGTLILTGTNDYTGGTTVSAGTLQGNATSLQGAITNNAAVVFDQAANGTYAGAMSGTGSLTKTGGGTLVLSGINTYEGGTTINGGTLSISQDANLGAAVGALILAGGTLQTTANVTMSRSTTLSTGGGTFDVATGTTLTQNGLIGGSGGLTKTGNGTLVLTENNTYGGGTIIGGGILQLGNGGTTGMIAGGVINNGTLAFNRSDNITFAGDISGSGSVAYMGPGTVTLTGASTYTGGTAITGGTVQAGSDSAFGTAGALTLVNGTLQATATFTIARAITLAAPGGAFDTNGNTLTLQGTITGGGGLTKQGTGTLELGGVNTYTGATTINAGTLALLGSGSIAGSSSVNLAASGATFDISGASGSSTIQDLTGIAGTSIVLGGNNLTVGTANSTTFAGVISGAGGLTKQGSGTLTLTGANTYTGGTTVNGGTLALSGTGSIAASSGVNLAAAGATFDISGAGGNSTIRDFAGVAGTSVVLGANSLTVGTANSTTFAGNISGTGGLAKTGSGTTTLSGVNSYAGTTTINAGTLALSGSGSIAASSGVALTASGATFDISASSGNQTIQDLSGVAGTSIVLGGNSLAVGTANSKSFAGSISGAGGLAKQGTGTLELAGVNAYSGPTTINAGTLALSGAGSIAASSGVNLAASGATFDISGANGSSTTQDLTGVAGTSIVLGGNSLTVGTANSTTFAGVISGAGGLTKQGSGTLTLSGESGYGGATTVNAGTLALSGLGSIGSSSGVNLAGTGASFDISGANGGRTVEDLSGVASTTVVLGANSLTVGTANSTNFAGNISGTGGLTKTGSGTTTLAGANSYAGTTTINAGTLALAGAGSIASSSGVSLAGAGAAFDISGASGNSTIRDLAGVAGTSIVLGANSLTVGTANSTSFAGNISGAGGLTKQGSGTLTLTGTNSYSGITTVSAGVLQGNTTSLQGAIVNNATVAFDQGADGTYGGAMSGSGKLTKTGAGNLTLSGSNSYAGGTTVSGGTLTGNTTSLQGAIANNAIVVFNQAANGTYAGAMSGSGELVKTGTGNLILTSANTYAGGTTVNGGTLTGTTTSLQGYILNNATVAFDQGTNGTYGGVMWGTGGLIKAGTGSLTLTGTNTYSGGTTVLAGTLIGSTTSLQGNILNNAAVVFDQASNGVYAGVLSGSGTLTKTGAGLLNLTGNSVVGGGATVSGGTLAVNGSLTSNVTVGTGGAIGGTGTITGLLTLNGGTLAPGNSIGTLNVTGNFVQTGGVYQVEANAGGQSDKIIATGTATIGGGTTVQVLAAQGTYQRSTTYTILSATGGLTGTYGGVTSNLAFLTPSLSYDANNVFLTLELLQNAFSFGGLTPNQRAVGRTLDTAFSGATGDFAAVLSAMTGLSTAQGPAVLDTISGQPYASFGTVNVLANLLFMNTVGQQMALARSGGPGTTRVALAEACEVACEMQEPPRWGAWFSGLGGAGTVGGNYNAGGLTYNLGGAAVGVDYRFDPRFLVGLAFGYSSGRQWVSGFQGLGTTDNYSAVLYASFTQGGFYADALAGYAYSDNRQQRVMQIPALATRYANGGTGANQFLGQIEAGYKIGFGLTETAQASVTPFARFQTVAASQKGFSEWGADSLNLNVQQQNTTSIRTVLGADLAANLPLGSERSLGVTLRLGWAHDYGDTARPMTAAFAGAPTVPFTIVGAQPMRDGAVVGFGLSTKITDSISAYARYDGELNGRDDNHNFSAGFRMTW